MLQAEHTSGVVVTPKPQLHRVQAPVESQVLQLVGQLDGAEQTPLGQPPQGVGQVSQENVAELYSLPEVHPKHLPVESQLLQSAGQATPDTHLLLLGGDPDAHAKHHPNWQLEHPAAQHDLEIGSSTSVDLQLVHVY